MKIALAQVASVRGDLIANVEAHVHWIREATAQGALLAAFPELSLTGYWPGLANELATTQDDVRLDPLQAACDETGCAVAAGLPTTGEGDKPRISMVLFTPGRPRQTYSKQMLHSDELPYFDCGEEGLTLELEGLCVAPAICYEALQPEHAASAADRGAKLYLASVAKPQSNVERANDYFPTAAREHSMSIAMVNGVGESEGFTSVGGSAAWSAEGACLGRLGASAEELLVCQIQKA